ncbi:MAG: ParB N-terminal domain-containing protein [bacterium]|nr:ParB N-terminal domain-containing protein [bacterium]
MAISGVIKKIDISDIKVSPMNVRLTDRESKIDELAKSIEEHGLMQPVVLMHANGGPPYQLIVGQRRFRAHELLVKEKKVKYKKILAVFETKLLTKTEIRIRSLAENM